MNPNIWFFDLNKFSLLDIQIKNFYNCYHCKEFNHKFQSSFETLNILISLLHKFLPCIWNIQLGKWSEKDNHQTFIDILKTWDITQAPSLDSHKGCLDMSLPKKYRYIFIKCSNIVQLIHLHNWFLLTWELSLLCWCLKTLHLQSLQNLRGKGLDRELQTWIKDSWTDSLLHKWKLLMSQFRVIIKHLVSLYK